MLYACENVLIFHDSQYLCLTYSTQKQAQSMEIE